MSTFVICPVLNEWQLTRTMLLSLDADQVDDVLILDNGSTDITRTAIRSWQSQDYRGIGSKLHAKRCDGWSIYEMWNHGFDRAMLLAGNALPRLPLRPCYVLVTNNDIELPRGAVAQLRELLAQNTDAWVSYPDYIAEWATEADEFVTGSYTRGVLSDGGMLGACFMLAGHRIPWRPLITDTTYEWWYGDNHLAEEIEQHGGRQLRALGVPVRHVNEATASKLPEGALYGMKYRDRQRWLTRYERKT